MQQQMLMWHRSKKLKTEGDGFMSKTCCTAEYWRRRLKYATPLPSG